MITVSDLELRAGARALLTNVTFRVQPGDRIGLVGRNGAGKTTLTKTLAGETLPAAGQITRGGEIGYLPQDPRTGDLDTLARDRVLSARGLDELARADDPEDRAVGVPVERDAREQACEEDDREEAIAADEPAEGGENCGGTDEERPGLDQVDRGGEPAAHSSGVVALVVGEAARRPVRLGRVASTRAMKRGDVLERNQDVAVELDVRHVVDRAVRGEHAVLVVARPRRPVTVADEVGLPADVDRTLARRPPGLDPPQPAVVGRCDPDGAAPDRDA